MGSDGTREEVQDYEERKGTGKRLGEARKRGNWMCKPGYRERHRE